MKEQFEKQKCRCNVCDERHKDVEDLSLDNGKLICSMCVMILGEIRNSNIRPFKLSSHMRYE
jgi:late competence protein required for DNA uptake (superfamily II DNA/RNA helicase)